jgi:CHAT domain-containing protein
LWAEAVTTMQRLGSWFPDRRRRAAFVLLCVSLSALRITDAHPIARAAFQDQPKEKSPAVRLVPSAPIEKELAGGATDAYEIEVGAGQFLHVVVDQIGIDVALTLYAPDGKQIATMDSPNGSWGLEQISTIAELSGIYKLEVASGDKRIAAGRYRIWAGPLHMPNEADRARVSAERTFVEAVQLNAVRKSDSLRRATQKYEEVLPLWRKAGDDYEEAVTLAAIGDAYENVDENQKALDSFHQALLIWRKIGNRDGEAGTLNDMGFAYAHLGDPRKAIEYYAQALPIVHTVGNREGEASVLSNIGLEYSVLGENEKALQYLGEALPLRRLLGDRRGEAITLNNIGFAHSALGELQNALDCFVQALPLLRATGDRRAEATELNNIGNVYGDLDNPTKSLEYFNQALAAHRAAGDRLGEAVTLNNIGRAYHQLLETDKALDYYQQGLRLSRTIGDRIGEARALTNAGAVYDLLGEEQKALDEYYLAMPLWQASGNRDGEAAALIDLGRLHAALGHKREALECFSRGLVLAREVRSPLLESSALSNLMHFWRKVGQPETAIFFGKQAVNEIQQMRAKIRGFEKQTQQGFVKSREATYRDLADLLIAQGRLPEAEQVLDLLKDEEYFEFIRRDSKNSAALTAPVNLTKDEAAAGHEYEANAERVTAIGNEYAALRSKPARTADEEQHLKELEQRVTEANEAWEKFLTSYFEELGKTKEANESMESAKEHASAMQSILRQLDPGTVALYTLVTDEKYRVIVITPNVTVAREYAIKADDLRKKVAELRQALMDPASDPRPKAQELYTILVAPVAKELDGAKAITLMWSLDGVLRYLPMAALYDGHQYLVEKYRNTVFTPSSIPGLLQRPNVSAWHGLGMGVSKSYGGFEALPAVPAELHRVIRVPDGSAVGLDAKARGTSAHDPSPHEKHGSGEAGVVPGQVMLDETFTEESMEKALEKKYSLVHIASHFDFSPGNETESFLLLGGKDEKGQRLTLADLRNNPAFSFRDTELLTLSACNTAVSGAAGDGREVDGLGVVAQQKGARAVVASLWSVNDSSTGELMHEFYQMWTTHRKIPKAEALRDAQVALLRGKFHTSSPHASGATTAAIAAKSLNHSDYSHPFYWAPFILIGNWR